MKTGVLYNTIKSSETREVEEDLMEMANKIKKSLENNGHEVSLINADKNLFKNLNKKNIEFVFNVCERFNGNSLFEPHVAAMLELFGVSFTGSDYVALSECNNKIKTKEILTVNLMPTPKYHVFCSPDEKLNPGLKFPLIVKPKQQENSIGITKDAVVYDEKSLRERIKYVNDEFKEEALVEEFIKGIDVEVGIIGNGDDLFILPLAKVNYENLSDADENKIFCYESKWDLKSKNYGDYVKADLSEEVEEKLKRLAVKIYKIFNIKDYGRIDFRLTENNEPYVIEVTANPGLSKVCSTLESAEWIGLSYRELVNKIFESALNRYDISKEEAIKIYP
ncbi:ATP-grasp domain-containing protein [Candidatus Woesearchaeota archaeon]|nr:ATP-grasp domain-containing protein [Candidatus Woesearchaeota archaeon]